MYSVTLEKQGSKVVLRSECPSDLYNQWQEWLDENPEYKRTEFKYEGNTNEYTRTN